VRLSGLYSRIRGEKEEQAAPKGANQAFVRKTTKYWVKQQDIR
jgi:SPX domain protein involved in polyphosphate accumulation